MTQESSRNASRSTLPNICRTLRIQWAAIGVGSLWLGAPVALCPLVGRGVHLCAALLELDYVLGGFALSPEVRKR